MSGNRCESYCKSRGREFDAGPVTYFRGEWSGNNFLNITKRITTLTNKHIPNRLINARKTDSTWLTTCVKKLIRKKKILYDKYKKSNNINHFETYKQFKNLVTREIRKSKKEELNK